MRISSSFSIPEGYENSELLLFLILYGSTMQEP